MKLTDPLKLGKEVEAALDILTSADTLKPLAANQGRVLKGFIDSLNALLTSDDTTLDELQEIVSYIKQNKTDLSDLGISNIAGLVDALAGLVSLTANETIGGQKRFSDHIRNDKNLMMKYGAILVSPGHMSIGATDASTVAFVNGAGTLGTYLKFTNFTASRIFEYPNKSGTIALIEDFESLAPSSRPTKLIDNVTQYTLVLEDKENHLKIINPIDLIAPSGVFSDGDEISFKNYSGGDVTMIEGANAALEVVSSQQMKVPSKGFGGMRYESAVKAGVFGQLKPI